MRKLSFLSTALVFLAVLAMMQQAQALLGPNDVPRISIDKLKAELNNPSYMIIDGRTPEDWGESNAKIQGAIREDPGSTDSWLSKYPSNKTLVFYCS